MTVSLRYALWLYSIKVTKNVANNPFRIFMGKGYLHKQAIQEDEWEFSIEGKDE